MAAGKSKRAAKSTDDLVREALEAALRRGGQVRLVTSGKKPENAGLFAGTATATKEAIERCLEGPSPLLEVTRTERAGRAEHRFVTITPQGVDHLLSLLPAEATASILQEQVSQLGNQVRETEEAWRRLTERQTAALSGLQACGLLQGPGLGHSCGSGWRGRREQSYPHLS